MMDAFVASDADPRSAGVPWNHPSSSRHQRLPAVASRCNQLSDPVQATKAALHSVALRAKNLRDEVKSLDHRLAELMAEPAPAPFRHSRWGSTPPVLSS
jgi:hypothetical protein